MDENESWECEPLGPSRWEFAKAESARVAPAGWRGGVSELEANALEAFWSEALMYARWEIGRYGHWRGQDEPVLADGYDAEGVVQAVFERLIYREDGGVQIIYTADEIRHELRSLVKHRVRWLHERSETGLVLGEWDVLPPRADGERVSIFDYLPGKIASPDEEAARKEEEQLLGEFKAGFEMSLGRGSQLADEFGGMWEGTKNAERRRQNGEERGQAQSAERRAQNGGGEGEGRERVAALRKQVRRRLARFAAKARGGVAEALSFFRGKG